MECLTGSGDLREAAVRFFAALRRLDESGVERIVAEPVPEVGLGRAIMDRLRRGGGGFGAGEFRVRLGVLVHPTQSLCRNTDMATKAPAKKKAASKKESGNRCWDGYEPVPGKKPGTKGSCKKKGS